MVDADVFVSSFLEHAGDDQVYDPVKAHDYYERTKKLKGRTSRTGLKTKAQKEGWSYVQSKVRENKKTELDSAVASNKAAVEQLRATTDQRRKALSTKLEALAIRIQGNVIKELAALPLGLPKEVRARREAEIRAKANKDRATGKTASKDEAKQIVSDLKTSVETARTNYKKLREGIQAKYDAKLQSEFDAIRTNVR